ncbi:MAG TPA: hypothetical protein VMJ64_13465 [Anaerolineales bacterium]|nr:hypothetical protein [Anaerolineales bacterium]
MSKMFDWLSEFLAHRKGLLPLIGLALILANLIVELTLPAGWLSSTNLLLHLGLIVAILGLMIAWAL